MSRTIKTTALTAALAMALGAGTANALEQGDILVRGGLGYIEPTGESDPTGLGLNVEADSGASFAFTLTYMMTDHFGIELLGAAPFEHDVNVAENGIKVGSTKHLPPTLTAQYYFQPSAKIRPYVGIGVNYTTFFDEDLESGVLPNSNLDLDDSFGLALQAGVDIDLNDRWFVNGSVWYMNIDTDASISGATNSNFEVAIDPMVLFAGIGYRF
ncbi:outer membrane protein [Thiohalobacter thiocyanaticus]|uniref:Outer membrane protein n=1 Tax=Thiohalobacter thiocyanaticus TaxID=585455 RepID=A0A1Z4VUG1_9GAMM|nr:OmpW family outer membrane protein [Thiohalobacter thiocyanaticus]BAZ95281.1 outer membrane protein [Thiohalobacter thiocyanaticus]